MSTHVHSHRSLIHFEVDSQTNPLSHHVKTHIFRFGSILHNQIVYQILARIPFELAPDSIQSLNMYTPLFVSRQLPSLAVKNEQESFHNHSNSDQRIELHFETKLQFRAVHDVHCEMQNIAATIREFFGRTSLDTTWHLWRIVPGRNRELLIIYCLQLQCREASSLVLCVRIAGGCCQRFWLGCGEISVMEMHAVTVAFMTMMLWLRYDNFRVGSIG